MLAKAKEHKNNQQYINALSEYEKAVSKADENSLKALCYDDIALIYAHTKRYGTALAYAQKAYNTYPTTSREVLLARLYYKTGDVEKAINRVNNVLKRDFDRYDR